ncbi:MAG: hypothetical protein ACOY3P_11810 [Planctomycetota bacterium]
MPDLRYPKIHRRDFMARTAAAVGAFTLGELAGAARGQEADAPRKPQASGGESAEFACDAYGGWPGRKFEPSGFFRLEKADRWWLVTPLGHAFLSWGINHMESGLLRQPYNREYWQRQFDLPDGSPSRDWTASFCRKARADVAAFGFNTLGCHTNTSDYPAPIGPYIQRVDFPGIAHYRALTEADFPDVFSSEFAEHCDGLAKREVEPRKDDPHLIAFTFCDCPVLTDDEAAAREVQVFGAPRAATPTWPCVLRNLGADAPGKQAYVRLVERTYSGRIEEFNATYRTFFSSFDDLLRARNWRPMVDPRNFDELRDNRLFLEEIVDRYYTTANSAVRRYDSRHMIFGDKINGNANPPDWLIELVGGHMDLVFYQTYGYYGEQEAAMNRWSRLTGKPLLNGDSSYSVPDEHMPNPLGPHCADQEERARRSLEFARQAFGRPDFVGWNWCGWMDGWNTIPTKEVRQHSGLQTPFGERYEPMLQAFSTLSRELYEIATRTG